MPPNQVSAWSGAGPSDDSVPWVFEAETRHSLPPPDLSRATREDLVAYLDNTWGLYETLFRGVKEEALHSVPNRLRRPLIFYLCHTAVLYVNKMQIVGLGSRINPVFEDIFQTGVDEMSWDDMGLNEAYPWPSAAEVWAYRKEAYALVKKTILESPAYSLPITESHPFWAIMMGFEHDRIHLETSAVLIRELPVHLTVRPTTWQHAPARASPAAVPANEMIDVPEGIADVGKPKDFPTYGWDNEWGRRAVVVPAFKASKFIVSNAEFLTFVEAGGYENQSCWDEEGWSWCQFAKAQHPVFWVKRPDGSWGYRATFAIIDMPWDWPVDVNCLEAQAFCRWKGPGYRLLTEAEHHRMRESRPGLQRDIVFRSPKEVGNLNLRHHSATPVDAYPPNAAGFHDVHGNVWQWTEDWFNALPGFRVHHLYDDYSTPFFDGRHNMIMGGSWVSTGAGASQFVRSYFRRHFFQNSGFRYVLGPAPTQWLAAGAARGPETGRPLSELLLQHYGTASEVLDPSLPLPLESALGFHRRVAQACAAAAGPAAAAAGSAALDVGCGVGGASFELARAFARVVAVDSSARSIAAARRLRERGSEPYPRAELGAAAAAARAEVEPTIDRSRVAFEQMDPCALPPSLGQFDAVLVACSLERMRRPAAFLDRLPSLLRPGGVALIATTHGWSEEFARQEDWLGDEAGLRRALEARGLRAAGPPREMPLVVREDRRRARVAVAQCTAWVRA